MSVISVQSQLGYVLRCSAYKKPSLYNVEHLVCVTMLLNSYSLLLKLLLRDQRREAQVFPVNYRS